MTPPGQVTPLRLGLAGPGENHRADEPIRGGAAGKEVAQHLPQDSLVLVGHLAVETQDQEVHQATGRDPHLVIGEGAVRFMLNDLRCRFDQPGRLTWRAVGDGLGCDGSHVPSRWRGRLGRHVVTVDGNSDVAAASFSDLVQTVERANRVHRASVGR